MPLVYLVPFKVHCVDFDHCIWLGLFWGVTRFQFFDVGAEVFDFGSRVIIMDVSFTSAVESTTLVLTPQAFMYVRGVFQHLKTELRFEAKRSNMGFVLRIIFDLFELSAKIPCVAIQFAKVQNRGAL